MKLCYVKNNWAYFTSGPIVAPQEQWGDNWHEVPYERNAGEPYYHSGYKIVKMAYDGPLLTPAERVAFKAMGNSGLSVEQINQGNAPWLETSWAASSPHVSIFAGVSIEEFERLVRQSSGKVYKFEEGTLKPMVVEEVPCVFCLKPMEDAVDNGFITRQPDGGGEVHFRFSFGSRQFDDHMEGTNYRGYICDECAQLWVGRMESF